MDYFEGFEYVKEEVKIDVGGVPTDALVYAYRFPTNLTEEDWSFETFNEKHSYIFSGENK